MCTFWAQSAEWECKIWHHLHMIWPHSWTVLTLISDFFFSSDLLAQCINTERAKVYLLLHIEKEHFLTLSFCLRIYSCFQWLTVFSTVRKWHFRSSSFFFFFLWSHFRTISVPNSCSKLYALIHLNTLIMSNIENSKWKSWKWHHTRKGNLQHPQAMSLQSV